MSKIEDTRTRVAAGIKTTAHVEQWPFAVGGTRILADKKAEPVKVQARVSKQEKVFKGLIAEWLDV